MQIAGSQFLFEQNNRLRDSLLNTQVHETGAVEASAKVSSNQIQNEKPQEEEIGASLKISGDGVKAAARQATTDTASMFAPTDFSTTKQEEPEQNAANGNDVLNQYRFFVQTAQYQGAEGTVRRIS